MPGAAATAPGGAPPAAADDPALDAIFRDGGTLAQSLPGFRFRSQQLAMAQAIARTIAARGQLVAEAGTGTGKTFAYLAPALLYGGKVIGSPGTKTLQHHPECRDRQHHLPPLPVGRDIPAGRPFRHHLPQERAVVVFPIEVAASLQPRQLHELSF